MDHERIEIQLLDAVFELGLRHGQTLEEKKQFIHENHELRTTIEKLKEELEESRNREVTT